MVGRDRDRDRDRGNGGRDDENGGPGTAGAGAGAGAVGPGAAGSGAVRSHAVRSGGGGRAGAARAYIGSFTSSGGRGVTVAAVDPGTGGLARIGDQGQIPDPSFLALPDHGEVLYCVSETEEGAVGAFSLRDPDSPAVIGVQPVRGSAPTHLSLAAGGRILLTANYASGGVTALPLTPGGAPDHAADVLDHSGSGPVPGRQEAPHAHQVLPDPSGRWIVAVDLGTDCVHVHALDPDTASLRPHSVTKLRAGLGPRHLTFHPGGRTAYVVNELESVVTVCAWDPGAGTLRETAEAPLLSAPRAGETPNRPSNGVVSPDGRFLYAANRGRNTIAVLAVTDAGKSLEPVTAVGCGGDWPRHLAADPTGTRLYAANERSGNVVWFGIDPETGVPHEAGALEVPAASCVVFR